MDPYIGEIRTFTFGYVPKDWASCDGSELSVSAQRALFTIIGTTYGGDGKNTFRLPDLRGCVPVGAGDGPGLTPRALNDAFGSATVELAAEHFAPHKHPLYGKDRATSALSSNTPGAGTFLSGPSAVTSYAEVTPGTLSPTFESNTIGRTGVEAEPRNNEQPYLGLQFCIALVGIYPGRP